MAVLATIAPNPVTHAAIFDSADFIGKGSHSAGVFGDIVLSNPSGEGIEGRYKWGLDDYLNLEALVGAGSDTRKFRAGGQVDYNILPDVAGQPGISAIGGGMLLKRDVENETKTGVRFTLTPLIHKGVDGLNGLPMLLYLGIPWSLTFQSGSYVASSEVGFGALVDIDHDHSWFVDSEAGFTLAKGESYIMIGVGSRFLPFEKPARQKVRSTREPRKVEPTGKGKDNEEEFRTEDFQR